MSVVSHLREGESIPSEDSAGEHQARQDGGMEDLLPTDTPDPAQVIVGVQWYNLETGILCTSRRCFLTGALPLPDKTILRLWFKDLVGEADCTRVLVHRCEKSCGNWIIHYSVLGQPAEAMLRWLQGAD